jgi:hypothetical protein
MEAAHRILDFERKSVEDASGATTNDHHNTEVRLACAPSTDRGNEGLYNMQCQQHERVENDFYHSPR